MKDDIVCLECGKHLQFLGIYGPARQGHLAQQHGMSVPEYLARHPGAPISSPGRLKRRRKAFKKWRRNGGREKINKRRRELYRNDPEYRQGMLDKNAADYQTHRTARLKKVEAYRNKNRKVINRRARQRYGADPEKRLKPERERRKRQRELLRAAWRPDDWDQKPLDWQIIGAVLLSQPFEEYSKLPMSNVDLGARLDTGRFLRCPYPTIDSLWENALSSDKGKQVRAAIKLISDIRKWVRRPGRLSQPKSGE